MLRQQTVPLVRHYDYCMFCNGRTWVLAPPDASELDVDAEFASAGRAFGSYDDHEGNACYACARQRWSVKERRTHDAGYRL